MVRLEFSCLSLRQYLLVVEIFIPLHTTDLEWLLEFNRFLTDAKTIRVLAAHRW